MAIFEVKLFQFLWDDTSWLKGKQRWQIGNKSEEKKIFFTEDHQIMLSPSLLNDFIHELPVI